MEKDPLQERYLAVVVVCRICHVGFHHIMGLQQHSMDVHERALRTRPRGTEKEGDQKKGASHATCGTTKEGVAAHSYY